MKRLSYLFSILLIATICNVPIADADSRVADCIELRGATSTASATLITLSVDVYAICTSEQLGRGNGQRPLYAMPEEESLFNLNSCSGPTVTPLVGSGRLGTATCSLRIGSNTLPSPRTGATSTSIKVWFAWDFSEKSVSVPHKSIPAGTNNGWGGASSGGSSGSGSGGGTITPQPAPVKTCTAAPAAPLLTSQWTNEGIEFKVEPALTGDKPYSLNWNYALLDSVNSKWGAWTSRTSVVPAASFTKLFTPQQNITRIAFAVFSANACGASSDSREIESLIGLPLAPIQEDQIVKNDLFPTAISVGGVLQLYGVAKSQLGLVLDASTATPDICAMETTSTIKLLGAGNCKVNVSSKGFQNKVGAKSTSIEFIIPEPKSPQVIPDYPFTAKNELSLKYVVLDWKTSAGLPVQIQGFTDDICSFNTDGNITFNGVGYCEFTVSQAGDAITLPAVTRNFQIQIVDSRKTLFCIKGKLVKKVIGFKVKCPAGYKVKK